MPPIIQTYPDMLDALRLRERDCDITARRIRHFRLFGGRPWSMPAVNNNSSHTQHLA